MSEKNWNDRLRRRMSDFGETPPEGLWEAVEAGLPGRGAAFPWWWALCGAAAAIAALLLVLRTSGPAPSGSLVAETQPSVEVAAAVDVVASGDKATDGDEAAAVDVAADGNVVVAVAGLAGAKEASGSESASGAGASDGSASASAAALEVPGGIDEALAVKPGDVGTLVAEAHTGLAAEQAAGDGAAAAGAGNGAVSGDEAASVAGQGGADTAQDGAGKRYSATDAGTGFVSGGVPDIRIPKTFRPGLSASLVAGAFTGAPSHNSFTEYGGISSISSVPGIGRAVPFATLSRNKETETNVYYNMDLRVGLMIDISLTPAWGLESGVQLSRLGKTVSSSAGELSTSTESSVSYIGVPLLAVYTPLRVRSFSLYASVGPTYEYAYSETWKTSSSIGGVSVASDSGTDKIGASAWSLGINAGAQFRIGDVGALFLQPGLSWHFRSADAPESYYTVHPLAFTLSAGLRFEF